MTTTAAAASSSQWRLGRWHDALPQLTFWVEAIRLMPLEYQCQLTQAFKVFLDRRLPPPTLEQQEAWIEGPKRRWMDSFPELVESLDRLKVAPKPLQHQASFFLSHELTSLAAQPYQASKAPVALIPAASLEERHQAYVEAWMLAFLDNQLVAKPIVA